ncbi:hypothetical protein P7H12_24845 [Paenibacillus larvae]|nr:hypothetical protein [Paenibacillus larvae]MDT2266169.1 hypothetical protein [Paenibacillus larvae]
MKIVKGKSHIEAYQITDERLNKNCMALLTPLYRPILPLFLINLKHWFDSRTADFEKEWKDWLEEMKDKGGGKSP